MPLVRTVFSRPLVALLLSGGSLLLALALAGVPSVATIPTTQAPASSPVPGPAPAGGLVTIESDLQQADNQTGVVTATGNVRITYPERGMVATSRQAQYFSKEGRLVLSGDVDVIDGDGQRIRAERLVYTLDQERLVARPTPGQQVTSKLRLALPPSQGPAVPKP